jgi:hypothetical protein
VTGAAPETRTDPQSRPSIGDLLSDVSQDVTLLMRQEVELAKAEIKQSATRAGKGAGMLGAAGVSAHFAVLFLSIAGWWALGDAIGRGWSGLVVALIWLLIAAALALTGRKEIKTVTGLPKTAETVKRIPDAVKGNES